MGKVGSKQRRIRVLAGLFVALLVALTLGGNTIRSLAMPKVVTAVPTAGTLGVHYEGSATVHPAAALNLTNPAGWPVLEVLVSVGDAVRKGEPLVRYDDSDVQYQLADLQSARKKQQMAMDLLVYNLKMAHKEDDEPAKLSAAAALETAKLDLEDQQRHIQQLQEELERGRELLAPVDGRVLETGAALERAGSGGPDIRLADTSKGYRIRLAVPAELADTLSLGDPLDAIALTDDASRTFAGQIAAIEDATGASPEGAGGTSAGAGGADAGGDVGGNVGSAGLTGARLLTIELEDGEAGWRGGERVTVRIEGSAEEARLLVNKDAVHYDSEGAYVYTISTEQGPLGNAYYAVETRIETAGSNAYATAIRNGLFEQSEIIVDHTGLILDGTRVRY
ncbi:hypothetical protein IDH44_23000 [Paenibacillus sp. IB182496]|uniref:HlyD family efflux transporter periplasmic adaptor subunit n=1 Tax=Paenibacillus sabuli TaxID=2772509 RepID=A0A927BYH5_9BACL|nr:hypothetical protein [Paenibacillus sabuli]MBD2848075.1 hypothetical protein [Paenibacillus sabuli]